MYDELNNQISLTNAHLIYTKTAGYIKAADVKLGDNLRVYSNERREFVDFTVKRISYQLKDGFIAPLTNHGTLLVNQIDTSCYAEIKDHYLADLIMFPVKFWYRITNFLNENTVKETNNNVDIGFYSKFLFDIGLKFFPSFFN